MTFISLRLDSLKSHNGYYIFNLNEESAGLIGLTEITFPPLEFKTPYGIIDVSLDEIDKTVRNPSRLLRRIFIEPNDNTFHYHFEFKNLTFQKVDSKTSFLTIRFQDETGKVIAFKRNPFLNEIFLTLQLKPDEEVFWI